MRFDSRLADFGRSSKPFPSPVRCFGFDFLATLTERIRPRGPKVQARLPFQCPGKFEARIESCFAAWKGALAPRAAPRGSRTQVIREFHKELAVKVHSASFCRVFVSTRPTRVELSKVDLGLFEIAFFSALSKLAKVQN